MRITQAQLGRAIGALALGLLFEAMVVRGARAEAAPIRVAITIDDLPGSLTAPAGWGSLRVISELVAILRAHRVASATGFVIAERVARDPEARAALAVWIAAGYELGNHSYAHPSLHRVELADYLDDLSRAEPLMRELAAASERPLRYFRYPYLEEGASARDRALLGELLHARGYQVARVSLDFFDWAWADPYARCLARADDAGLRRLSTSYLERASAYLAWSVASAERVLRRALPHVLLLHANVATAHNLDALLTTYERAGVTFIPLSEALTDPAYGAHYEGEVSHVLTLASARSGRALAPAPGRPDALLTVACR